ncbi:MAG TPA: hypothetical protein VJK26_01685 [Patescibacteria group bacterium]|nr:hypothetical protein [Patescibacteria group bacterium]
MIKILAILLLVILQLSFFSKWSFFSVIPNLIYLVSLVLLLRGFFQDALLVASLGGLFLDLASPLRFGIYTLLLLAVLLLLNFVILKAVPPPNIGWIYFFLVMIFLFLNLIIFLYARIPPGPQIIYDALINGFWGIIVYFLTGRFLKPQEEIRLV